MSGLPALPSATMRPSRMPTSALTMPQWSRTTAPVITGRARPRRGCAVRLAHRLADRPCRRRRRPRRRRPQLRSSLDLDQQVGVGEPDPVAGGRAVERGVARRGRAASGRSRRAAGVERAADAPRSPATTRPPASGDERRRPSATPGSKRTAVPAGTSSRRPRAASRSNCSAGLASAKWKCEPTWTGRSPVLTHAQRRSPSRPALSSIGRRRRRGSRPGRSRVATPPAGSGGGG